MAQISRILPLSIAAVVLLATVPCQAITINTTFKDSGSALAGFGTAGSAPANASGGGSLQALIATAANYWESIYTDSFTLSIQYGWFSLASGTTGTHSLVSEGGSPHRETSGSLAFDNDQSTVWFADPTPTSASEFTTLTNYTADFGGGTMNVGREYTGGQGAAANHDLLTTVIHEMGHALGLSSANDAYQTETSIDLDIDLTLPRAFPGSALPVNSGNAHLNLDHALMRSNRPGGVRRLLSDADILANGQVSQFGQINLNALIPEPGTIVMFAIGLFFLPVARRAVRQS